MSQKNPLNCVPEDAGMGAVAAPAVDGDMTWGDATTGRVIGGGCGCGGWEEGAAVLAWRSIQLNFNILFSTLVPYLV